MLTALPIALFILFPLILLGIRLRRPRFAYFWLVAALGVLIAWPVVLALRFTIPSQTALGSWQPEVLFPVSPLLLVDEISWPFALALASLAVAVILTDVARASEADWLAWASSLALTALGLFSVLAGNLLSLALGWAAIDLVELVVLLLQVNQSTVRERIIGSFVPRAMGILVLVAAGLISTQQSPLDPLSFASVSPEVGVLLLIAAGLRLGVFPLHQPFVEGDSPGRRGLGTLLRLIPVGGSLVLLPRTAMAGVPSSWSGILLALTGIAGLYAAVTWLNARDELDGRPFWILGVSALSVASAIRGLPAASLAWGTAALLSGSFVFLMTARHRRLVPVIALGLSAFSGLPYTPSWQGVALFTAHQSILPVPLALVFLPIHALLLAGILRHSLRAGQPLAGVERWVWVIYPFGLAFLPLTQFAILFWNLTHPSDLAGAFPDLLATWPALASLVIFAALITWARRGIQVPSLLVRGFETIFSFNWLYRLLWSGYHLLGRGLNLVSLVFEGEGGFLWTLLLLVLLLSLIAGGNLGG